MFNKFCAIFMLILTMLFLGLSGCKGATPVPEADSPESTDAEPAPKLASAVETEEVNHCLDCHSDKQRLIDTADPVVEVEPENEGAG